MKAFTTLGDGIGALAQVERPAPEPGPRGVLVQISAAALNYRDLLVVKGVGRWKPREPRVPISDGVGRVVAVGSEVTRVWVGDRVSGIFLPRWLAGELTAENSVGALGGPSADGVLADLVVFEESAVVTPPASLSDAEAATLPVAALTAWHAVARRSAVAAGDSVLILGTGGVALFATQFARALGARPIVTSSSDAKLERAEALGAAHVVNYRRHPSWEEQVLELTDGRGVDHVVETVGGANLNRSLTAVRESGTISFIGLLEGPSAPIDTYRFVLKNVRLHGIETGSREMFEELNRFVEAHGLKPVLDRAFPSSEVREALAYLESGAHFGKVSIAC